MKTYAVIIEEDAQGWFFSTVPELPGCHTEAESLEELRERTRKAIATYLRAVPSPPRVRFHGVEQMAPA